MSILTFKKHKKQKAMKNKHKNHLSADEGAGAGVVVEK